MSDSDKNKYSIGVFVSLSIGSVLYLIFSQWIFLGIGLICAIIFLIKLITKK